MTAAMTTAHLDADGFLLTLRDLPNGWVAMVDEWDGECLFADRASAREAIYGTRTPDRTTHISTDGLKYTLTAVNGRRYKVQLDSWRHPGGRFFPDRAHAHHWLETGEWLDGECPWMAGRGVEVGPNEVTLAEYIDRSFGPDSCINRVHG